MVNRSYRLQLEESIRRDIDRIGRRVDGCIPRAGDLKSKSAHAYLTALLRLKQESLATLRYRRGYGTWRG